MKIIKKMIAAFSLYSRIPMPRLSSEADYEGAITFLPLVGAVIAAVLYGLSYLLHLLGCPTFAASVLITVVPLVVTGGFHVDGFMDTTDALRSYADREKKIEILKDAHVGSFAVTGLITAILFMLFSAGQIMYIQSVKDTPVILYRFEDFADQGYTQEQIDESNAFLIERHGQRVQAARELVESLLKG